MEFLEGIIEDPAAMMLIATGIVLWIIFYIIDRNPPKKINHYYGYRSKRSMQSQEAWDYAQKFSNKVFIKFAYYMILLGIVSSFVDWSVGVSGVVGTLVLIILILIPVYITEQELKSRFK